jgi:hypothetical protein
MKPFPDHVGIEHCAEGFLVAFTEGTKVVKDDGFEVLLTLRTIVALLSSSVHTVDTST